MAKTPKWHRTRNTDQLTIYELEGAGFTIEGRPISGLSSIRREWVLLENGSWVTTTARLSEAKRDAEDMLRNRGRLE